MKKIIFPIIIIAFVFVSCAPGPNELVNTAGETGNVAGFWLGLWHGFISFFTFIISLFNDNVHIYEIHNNGGWYNLGFLLGASIFFGGSGGGAGKKYRCK